MDLRWISEFFTKNWGLKLVSLLIASVLWMVVVSEKQTEEPFKARLTLVNIPQDMVIVGGVPQFINVRVVGPRTIMASAKARRLEVSLDLSGIQDGTSTFEILPSRLGLPRGLEVTDISPSKVTIQANKRAIKMLRVVPRLTGTPAEGFEVTDVRALPDTVEVEGAERVLKVHKEIPTEVIDISGLDGSLARAVTLAPPDPTIRRTTAGEVRVEVTIAELTGEREFLQVPVRLPAGVGGVRPEVVSVTLSGNLTVLSRIAPADIGVNLAAPAPAVEGLVPLRVTAPEQTKLVKIEPTEVLLRPVPPVPDVPSPPGPAPAPPPKAP